jgi:hypothetical protein
MQKTFDDQVGQNPLNVRRFGSTRSIFKEDPEDFDHGLTASRSCADVVEFRKSNGQPSKSRF